MDDRVVPHVVTLLDTITRILEKGEDLLDILVEQAKKEAGK